MKNITKIGLTLLVLTVVGVAITTATANDKLPTKNEVTTFLSDMNGKNASDIFCKIKDDHSTWNADLLEGAGNKEAIAVYYTDSRPKGYGSIYYMDGKTVSPSDLKGYAPKESYKGESEKSDNTTENATSENTSIPTEENDSKIIKDDETEKNSNNTYEAFTKALDSYDGKLDCTSQGCAQSLSDYFKGLGWGTEVKYCVAVNTSNEGTVYVVLGV